MAQQVVGTAALGLPQPVRNVVGSRWGSRLAVLIVLALLATGIATVDWTSGRPRLKIDRERAQEVRKEVRERVDAVAGREAEPPSIERRLFGGHDREQNTAERKTIGARIFKDHK